MGTGPLHIYRKGRQNKRKGVSYMLSRGEPICNATKWNAVPVSYSFHLKHFFLLFKVRWVTISVLFQFPTYIHFNQFGLLLLYSHTHTPKITFWNHQNQCRYYSRKHISWLTPVGIIRLQGFLRTTQEGTDTPVAQHTGPRTQECQTLFTLLLNRIKY